MLTREVSYECSELRAMEQARRVGVRGMELLETLGGRAKRRRVLDERRRAQCTYSRENSNAGLSET